MSQRDEDLGQWEDEQARQRGIEDAERQRSASDEIGRLLTVARGYVERRERTMPVEPALVVEVVEQLRRLSAQRDRMHAQRARLREDAIRDEARWLSPFIYTFPENLALWREYCALAAREA